MNYLIPPINAIGKFRAKEPLDKILDPNINYKVIAVRTIREYLDTDTDVLNLIYLPEGLTEQDFNNDLNENMPIVTLLSPSGSYIYIPANKLASIPDVTGYKFRRKIISVDLGFIPDDTDLTWLNDEIKDLVLTKYGVEPDVSTVNASQAYLYTDDEYQTFETKRELNVKDNLTCYAKLNNITKELELMKKKLEAVLKVKSG